MNVDKWITDVTVDKGGKMNVISLGDWIVCKKGDSLIFSDISPLGTNFVGSYGYYGTLHGKRRSDL